jgi:hypothetical protein
MNFDLFAPAGAKRRCAGHIDLFELTRRFAIPLLIFGGACLLIGILFGG